MFEKNENAAGFTFEENWESGREREIGECSCFPGSLSKVTRDDLSSGYVFNKCHLICRGERENRTVQLFL